MTGMKTTLDKNNKKGVDGWKCRVSRDYHQAVGGHWDTEIPSKAALVGDTKI